MMRGQMLIAVAVGFLAGCETVSSEALPPVPVYSPAVQSRAAIELEALPVGSCLELLLGDYAVMRAQLRILKFKADAACGDAE
jgi:hypothetical protein